jgi:pimeloyl-ACP methyl ester carboxylesterase
MNSRAKKFISPLYVNGMKGRLLRMPSKKSKGREIFLLYGHHSSLERMFGIAEVLNEYGTITMPDLPGFGGMDSFYTIGSKPSLDAYADYLASLFKLNYKRRRVTIVAMSFSVPLVTRMLQKYPELTHRIDFVISLAGFVRKDDFIFSKREYWGLRALCFIFSKRLPAAIMANTLLTKPVLKMAYMSVNKSHNKMKTAGSQAELNRRIEFESQLWKINDLRTRMVTMRMMLTIDVCKEKVDTSMYHITASEDRYFDNEVVEQHMKVVFSKVEVVQSDMPNHAPTVIASAKEAAPYIPQRIRKLL